MDIKERENFNRNSTLIVEHTKEGFSDLIEFNVTLGGYNSFEKFINDKQHDIYHLCYNRSRCCQCPSGYVLPRSRILHPTQLEILLNKNGPKKTCHNPGRTADFCCCFAHPGLTTNVLDVTLARCLLVNFCQDVFWYSCLTAQTLTLEDFLTRNKHHIYHLYDINSKCCQCPPHYVFPTQRQLITKAQWNKLFSKRCLPCPIDRKRPVGGPQTICASSVNPGITVSSLGTDLSQVLIDHCCPLKQSIEKLVEIRNNTFGHAKEARIPENEYVKYRYKIESYLVFIGQICNKQSIVQQKLKDLDRRTLDSVLLMQTIREQLNTVEVMSTQMSEVSADIRNDVTSAITQHAKKLEQHIDKKMEALSSQDPARRQIEEKRKKLLENTKESIQGHTKENTFVHTSAVTEAVARIMQYGILILIGPPGSGKSRIGIELLRQFSIGNEKCLPLQIDDISQWQDMCNTIDVVLVDDVFGRTNCSYSDDDHSKLLQTIYTTIKNKNIKVILTLRNNIYRKISTNTESQRTFRVEHVLDLSKHQMTVKEKKSCLMNYFAKNNIVETDDIKKENVNDDSILDTAITVYLHADTILKILYADIGTHIGFPETCYLFASHRKFTRQGHTFFCHPTEHLKKEIDQLRREGCTKPESMIDFTLLVDILLNGDSVNVNDVDQEEFISIMESMYLNPLSNIPPSYMIDSADRFNGKYLKINNEGNYCFQHRLISEAVMLSYSSADPKRVIPLLRFDFITEMTRPRNYKPSEGEVIFTVPKSCYSLLAQRLLQLLDVECRKGFSKERPKPYSFVQNLCKSKIITMTGNTILQEMITQYKYNEYNNLYGEFIHDHRFSGQDPYFIYAPYFYLPAALLLFCNTDNDPLYQFLYDKIHNTLTSESDRGVMRVFKETMIQTLNFVVCTCDVKKSTVILKILTDHNIKLDYLPWQFSDNIVRCQGLPAIQLLFDLHGLSHVFNITELLSETFMSFNSERITIDDNMKQFITSVIVNNKHGTLPVTDIVEYVCRYGQLDFVKDMCERFDSSLFDVHYMIIQACRGSNTDVIQWLMEKYDGLYNVQKVLDTACSEGSTEGVKVILDRSDYSLLDMKSAMNQACSSYGDNTKLVKWLCENVDNNLFDMKTVMNKAFSSGDIELVKWLCENVDNNLFDMKTGMNEACSRGNTKLVKWLCERFDNKLFDMKTGMNKACSSFMDNTELVKWLCENVDNNLFDMKTVMNEACSSGKTKLVKWLCERFDNNLFDMKTAMNKACSSWRDNTELVKWLCENVDNNLFDMKTVMNEACSSGKTKLVKWMCENVDNNLFDMKTVMNEACSSGNIELVKWLCENVDNYLFDMKTVMNEACSSGKTKLVKWLCEKLDNNLFDMKTGMNKACSRGKTELVKWLCENVDNNLFNMKTGMNIACSEGNIELVKWLCESVGNNLFDMETVMNMACSRGKTELVKWLCENVDNSLFDMETVVDYACSSSNTELVKWILTTKKDSCLGITVLKEVAKRMKAKEKRYKEEFHLLSIKCDGILVDCIVDNRMECKFKHLYHDIECRKLITKFNETEFYRNDIKEPDTQKLGKTLLEFEKLYLAVKGKEFCWRNEIFNAIDMKQSIVIRWILENEGKGVHLEKALDFALKKIDIESAKALSWCITRNFSRMYSRNLKGFQDMYPGVRCLSPSTAQCKSAFCSEEKVIVVITRNDFIGLPKCYSGFKVEIRNLTYIETNENEGEKLKQALSQRYKESHCLDVGVSAEIAKSIFAEHSNLTLICPSVLKSSSFSTTHVIKDEICIQLYCKRKGIRPFGENHFPATIQAIPTDIIEGHVEFMTNLNIGEKIGPSLMAGTLGGFVRYMHLTCFLTCAHVFFNVDQLKQPDYRELPGADAFIHTQAGQAQCGVVIRKVFEYGDPTRTSVDAAVGLLQPYSTVDPATGPTLQSLGIHSLYLNDICIDYATFKDKLTQFECYGAKTGHFKSQVKFPEQSQGVEIEFCNATTTAASANGQHFQPLLMYLPAHIQLRISSSSTAVQMFNQIALQIPLKGGDSGTAIYITNHPGKKNGCVGIAIAFCNGLSIVTPLKDILTSLK